MANSRFLLAKCWRRKLKRSIYGRFQGFSLFEFFTVLCILCLVSFENTISCGHIIHILSILDGFQPFCWWFVGERC